MKRIILTISMMVALAATVYNTGFTGNAAVASGMYTALTTISCILIALNFCKTSFVLLQLVGMYLAVLGTNFAVIASIGIAAISCLLIAIPLGGVLLLTTPINHN